MNVENNNYLIIGGAPKAGTTSLFKYLSEHPDTCASSVKETRFFLDSDYPIPSSTRFNGCNLSEYEKFFFADKDNEKKLRVEATPDYMYTEAALRIADVLPSAKIVFILRDPVEKIVSWYKYARHGALIKANMSFEDYVMLQVNNTVTENTPVYFRALEQGRYEKYLPHFRRAFGDRCMTVEFSDLRSEPQKVMTQICEFSGLDGTFFETYSFKAENVSHGVRWGWINRMLRRVRPKLAYALHNKPKIMAVLRKLNQILEKVLAYNNRETDKVIISDELAELIRIESSKYVG